MVGVVAYQFVVSGMTAVGAAPFPRFSFVDFRDTVWLPTREFWTGHDPYDQATYLARHPYAQEFSLYAPVVLLLGTPFAVLPFEVAVALWALVLVAASLVIVKVGLEIAGLDSDPAWVALGAGLLLITPVGNQPFSSGQFAIVSAAGTCTALGSRSVGLQGIGVMLAIVKPQVGLPLLLVMVLSRRSRGALYGVVAAATCSAPAAVLLVWRAGGVGAWGDVLVANLRGSASSPYTAGGRADSTRIDLLGLSQRVGLDVHDLVEIALVVIPLLAGTILLIVLRMCRGSDACPSKVDLTLWWSAALGVMVLVTPTELYGYLVAVPAFLVAATLAVSDHRPWWSLPLVLALAVPFVHVHRVDVAIFGVQLNWVNSTAIFAASLAIPIMALLSPGPVRRGSRT